jgi:DNA-binding NtrC family response regulator
MTALKGLFEQANGDTLFIDEIGELSSEVQVMFCACRSIAPVNAPRAIAANANVERVISKASRKKIAERKIPENCRASYFFNNSCPGSCLSGTRQAFASCSLVHSSQS